ncbi:SdpI family protein [Staphylococcus chromogenes]|nr:SdpI family protein [Staphylococcus chromogenes]
MIISALLLVLALFLLIVGGLAWARRLPGNGVIGLKVKEVRTSREIWDAAHAAAGPMWVLAGAVLMFAGLLVTRIEVPLSWILAGLALLATLVFIGAGANMGARVAGALGAASDDGGCSSGSCGCGSGGCGSEAPEVDVDALRAAMKASNTD